MSKTVEWGQIHKAGNIVCTCDGPRCGEEEVVEFDNGPSFNEAQQHIESQGWFSKRIGDAWYDFHSRRCYETFCREHGL
jgi:hypothetical protein|nr:MAG TPA: hypothetical protein [Caudoviricetes sp.]